MKSLEAMLAETFPRTFWVVGFGKKPVRYAVGITHDVELGDQPGLLCFKNEDDAKRYGRLFPDQPAEVTNIGLELAIWHLRVSFPEHRFLILYDFDKESESFQTYFVEPRAQRLTG